MDQNIQLPILSHNRIDLSKFLHGDKYTVIYYKEIYDFFVENKGAFLNCHYCQDFINAMYKHTKDYNNELEEEMQRRFLNAIYKSKEQKKDIT